MPTGREARPPACPLTGQTARGSCKSCEWPALGCEPGGLSRPIHIHHSLQKINTLPSLSFNPAQAANDMSPPPCLLTTCDWPRDLESTVSRRGPMWPPDRPFTKAMSGVVPKSAAARFLVVSRNSAGMLHGDSWSELCQSLNCQCLKQECLPQKYHTELFAYTSFSPKPDLTGRARACPS